MTTRLITPPAAMAVALADAKLNLRVDGTGSDDLITLWLKGIIAHGEHLIGRSIINQTWRTTLDSFPDAFKLVNPPIVSVGHVKYYDTSNELQTLDPADYTVDAVSEPGYVVPAPDVTWPDTYDKINAVEVEYVAGYGETDASTPEAFRLYVLAKLAEQFDPSSRPRAIQESFIDRLLDPLKVYA